MERDDEVKEKHTPDGSGAANNYVYDASGNLIKDVQENINNIVWTADGKVDKICKDGCPKPDTIYFYYDARGDRIAKIDVFYTEDACSGTNRVATITKTFYVRDANGEILAIYKKIHLNRICTVSGSTCTCTTNDDELSGTNDIPLTEWLVYGLKGHGRFATVKPTHDTYNTYKTPGTSFARTMKFKEYELKDHLGDVRATFNDLKGGSISNGFYLNTLGTFNYYPFGMLEPTTPSSSSYRFGYNGMERDDEVKEKRTTLGSGKGNSYDYGARFYDPRGARFLSLDPMKEKYANLSPFVAFENNPIYFKDPDGKDATVTINGNDILIEVTIHIYGDGATKAKAKEMQRSLMNAWGGEKGQGWEYSVSYDNNEKTTYNVKFKINVLPNDYINDKVPTPASKEQLFGAWQNPDSQISTNYVKLSNNELELDEGNRSFVYMDKTGIWKPDNKRTWWHEFGHLLGLPDYYYDQKGKNDCYGSKERFVTRTWAPYYGFWRGNIMDKGNSIDKRNIYDLVPRILKQARDKNGNIQDGTFKYNAQNAKKYDDPTPKE